MTTPRYASALAKALARALPSAQRTSGDRERGIASIERGMRAREKRRRLIGSLGVVAAIAAAAVLTMTFGSRRAERAADGKVSLAVSPAGHGARLSSGDHSVPLPERVELASGQRIETPAEGGASLKLSTGTSMDLAGSTTFRVESQGATERFSLHRGEVSAHVAKLAPGQRFVITTPDAEVEVRGTRFKIRVLDEAQACAAGIRTRLEVSEGLVEVRSGPLTARIAAGQSWPPDCVSLPALAALDHTSKVAPTPLPNAAPHESQPTARHHAVPSTPTVASDPSATLRQQNDLFAAGVALRRQGDFASALRTQEELLTRFPGSPLAENAMVERMRLLASRGDARARAEAESYLARFPRGFAVIEARKAAGATR